MFKARFQSMVSGAVFFVRTVLNLCFLAWRLRLSEGELQVGSRREECMKGLHEAYEGMV